MKIIVGILLILTVLGSQQSFLEKQGTPAPFSEDLGKELCAFAIASYCPAKKVEKWKCGKLCREYPKMEDVYIVKDGLVEDNHAYLGYYSELEAIIIAWRGTLSIQNWVEDFNFIKTKYPYCAGCEVHEGFWKAYDDMQDSFWEGFNSLRTKYPNAKIMVTGHSLGAALSVFNAADLVNHNITDFTFYNFGLPRCGNSSFAMWLTEKMDQKLYRVTHHKDPVPHLPPQDFGFHHLPTEVFYEKHSKPKDKHIICNGSGEDPDCSDKYLADLEVIDHVEYMGYQIIPIVSECML